MKLKNTLEWIKSRLDNTDEHISELECRRVEIIQAEEKKIKKISEDSFKKLGQHSILTFASQESQKEREKETENILLEEICNSWKLP